MANLFVAQNEIAWISKNLHFHKNISRYLQICLKFISINIIHLLFLYLPLFLNTKHWLHVIKRKKKRTETKYAQISFQACVRWCKSMWWKVQRCVNAWSLREGVPIYRRSQKSCRVSTAAYCIMSNKTSCTYSIFYTFFCYIRYVEKIDACYVHYFFVLLGIIITAFTSTFIRVSQCAKTKV